MVNFNDIQMAQARYQEMVPQTSTIFAREAESETAVFSLGNTLAKLGQQLQGVRLTRTNKNLGYR